MLTQGSLPEPGVRETIQFAAVGERKYIRYFDGRGHFAHVCIHLLPRPGERCSVSVDSTCPIPEQAHPAMRAALQSRFAKGLRRVPLIGMEARLMGGSHLPNYASPAAFASAACMAYDEALPRAVPVLVEPWIGLALRLRPSDDLPSGLKRLIPILTQMRISATEKDKTMQRIEVPLRLLTTIQEACRPMGVRTFPLPPHFQYRPFDAYLAGLEPSRGYLDEWT